VLRDATTIQHRIRLGGIDCPERKQPWNARAKESLSDHVFDQAVTVAWTSRDRYRRIVGKVLRDARDVNLTLVADGLCW
jgi:endonuclease YncB( thermonuclease family)